MKPRRIHIPEPDLESDFGQWKGFDSPTEYEDGALESAMTSLVTPDDEKTLHAPLWNSPQKQSTPHTRLRQSSRKHGNLGAPPSVYEPFAILGSRRPYLIGLKSPGAYLSFMQADPSSVEDEEDRNSEIAQRPTLLRGWTAPPVHTLPSNLRVARKRSRIPRWAKTYNVPLSFTPPPPNALPTQSSPPSSVKLRTRLISTRQRCESNALTFFAVFDPETGGMVPFKSHQLPRSHLLRPKPGPGLPLHPKSRSNDPPPPAPLRLRGKRTIFPPPRQTSLVVVSRRSSNETFVRKRTQSKVIMNRRKTVTSMVSVSSTRSEKTTRTDVPSEVDAASSTQRAGPSIKTTSSSPASKARAQAAKEFNGSRKPKVSMTSSSAPSKPTVRPRSSGVKATEARRSKTAVPKSVHQQRSVESIKSSSSNSVTKQPQELPPPVPSLSTVRDKKNSCSSESSQKKPTPIDKDTYTRPLTSSSTPEVTKQSSMLQDSNSSSSTSHLLAQVSSTKGSEAGIKTSKGAVPKINTTSATSKPTQTMKLHNRNSGSSEKTVTEPVETGRTTPRASAVSHTKSQSLPASPDKFFRPALPKRSATDEDKGLVAFPTLDVSNEDHRTSPTYQIYGGLGRKLSIVYDEPLENDGFFEHPELVSPPAAFNFWDLPGHDDCDPQLTSRFSTSTTSTSNYVDIDFPVEESARYFAQSALDKHARIKRNISITSRETGSSSTVNLIKSKTLTSASSLAQVWRANPPTSPPSAFPGKAAYPGSPDKVRPRLPSLLSKLKRGSRGKDSAIEVMTVMKEDMAC